MDSTKPAKRILISHEHDLSFINSDKTFIGVRNISMSGVALSYEDFSRPPKIAETVSGYMKLGGRVIPLQLVVKHITNFNLGCEIISSKDKFIDHFQQYFDEHSF